MTQNLVPAKLDDSAISEIRDLEQETNTVLVALNPAPTYAELSTEAIGKLRKVEQRLGVVMVAYNR
jgi:hypothetical protein